MWQESRLTLKLESTCETNVRFEVFRVVTMKDAVFWDVAPCRSCVNRHFGGTHRLHLQGRKISERGTSVSRWPHLSDFFYPEDGGDTFLRYVGSHKIYSYTAPHPRRFETDREMISSPSGMSQYVYF
jgi:hypothetical protein